MAPVLHFPVFPVLFGELPHLQLFIEAEAARVELNFFEIRGRVLNIVLFPVLPQLSLFLLESLLFGISEGHVAVLHGALVRPEARVGVRELVF